MEGLGPIAAVGTGSAGRQPQPRMVQLFRSRVGVGVGVGDGDGVAVGVGVGVNVRVAVGVARTTTVLRGVGEGDGLSDGRRPFAKPKIIRTRAARTATTVRPAFDPTRRRIALIRKWARSISSYLNSRTERNTESPCSFPSVRLEEFIRFLSSVSAGSATGGRARAATAASASYGARRSALTFAYGGKEGESTAGVHSLTLTTGYRIIGLAHRAQDIEFALTIVTVIFIDRHSHITFFNCFRLHFTSLRSFGQDRLAISLSTVSPISQ